jgi:hypothetical protein
MDTAWLDVKTCWNNFADEADISRQGKSRMNRLMICIVAVASMPVVNAGEDAAPAPAQDTVLETVVVTGYQPGPSL